MYVCTYEYIFMYYVYIYICMHVCMYVCMHVCVLGVDTEVSICTGRWCMYVCMFTYVYVCMYKWYHCIADIDMTPSKVPGRNGSPWPISASTRSPVSLSPLCIYLYMYVFMYVFVYESVYMSGSNVNSLSAATFNMLFEMSQPTQ